MSGTVASAHIDIDAPASRVWTALTEPGQIKEYMFGSQVETDWKVGSPITWSGEYEGSSCQDKGEVVTYDEPSELAVTHFSPMTGQEDLPENYHTVTYSLSESEGVTHLALTQDNNSSQEEADRSRSNWEQVLQGLKAHVEKG
jgi:uncharacterized protein YndB with AHSA1/START domain